MKSFSRILFPAVLFVVAGGCSIALKDEWDPAGRPCSPKGECDEGYSCLVTNCVADDSLPQGETCNEDAQCSGQLICAPEHFVCSTQCGNFYRTCNNVDGDYYCEPVKRLIKGEDGEPTGEEEWIGVCRETQDCFDQPCNRDKDGNVIDPQDLNNLCVRFSSRVYACLPGCEVTWSDDDADPEGINENYSDNCGGTALEPKFCQPVGQPGEEGLICLDSSLNGASEGETCDLTENPCRQPTTETVDDLTFTLALQCIDGICRRHCNTEPDMGVQCATGQRCCPSFLGSDSEDELYGFCMPNNLECE